SWPMRIGEDADERALTADEIIEQVARKARP
ncbi:hypothetical protein LCGC14_0457820, partial [marine sediment metagenome]